MIDVSEPHGLPRPVTRAVLPFFIKFPEVGCQTLRTNNFKKEIYYERTRGSPSNRPDGVVLKY
jgi:hypothetical protein